MSASGCLEMVDLLNLLFTTGLIMNDGHEIYARLGAGDDLADIAADYCEKLGRPGLADESRKVIGGWLPIHLEAVAELTEWALSKLDTEDRINIRWKGDADSPQTVTRFELRDHELVIEFAHPPGQLVGRTLGA